MRNRIVRFLEPWKAALVKDDAEPVISSPTDVLIQSQVSLVSAGTEIACLSGREPWFPLPNTPGYGAVGEVLEVGEQVSKVRPGDFVFTHGPHAERFTINTTDRYTGTCVPIPPGLRADQAVFARMITISLAAIRVSHIELGDRVLVTGLGQIGNFAAQLAQLQGAEVIAAEISASRRRLAAACKISNTLDSGEDAWIQKVRTFGASRGISTAIEATGQSAVAASVVPLIAHQGEIILLGTPRTPFEANLTDLVRPVHLPPYVEFRGALEWRFPTFREEYVKHSIERNSEIALDLIRGGRIVVSPLLTTRARPEQAAEVYEAIRTNKEGQVGVVFDWT